MDILRFIIAGNVDDGKSTLTGRLLYDTQSIQADIIDTISKGEKEWNLAHITDGLRAERDQGITIDVAYKYFNTASRKYIIADAPGHFQYTRNVVTGASNADAMIILIDAKNGITEQTRRHSQVASFLRIANVLVAINKMDIVGYEEEVYSKIKKEYEQLAATLQLNNVTYLPISALQGDNIVSPSANMPWYVNGTMMQYLEQCTTRISQEAPMRCSIQYVIHDNGVVLHAAKMLAGTIRVGNAVCIYPDQQNAIVTDITVGYEHATNAHAGQNIMLTLGGAAAKRGDIIAVSTDAPVCGSIFTASICWLDHANSLKTGEKYILRLYAMEMLCIIRSVVSVTNISPAAPGEKEETVRVNDFAIVNIETEQPICYDRNGIVPEMARGVLIDLKSNYTSAAITIQ